MVLGAGATAAWVDLDGFVVAITTREVPLLPNAVALAAGSGTLERPGLAPGSPARVAPGRIDLGSLRIAWSPADPPAWDPTVPIPRHAGPKGGRRSRSGHPHRPGDCGQRPAPRWPRPPRPGPRRPGWRAGEDGAGHRDRPRGRGRAHAPVPGCPGARPGTRRGGRSRVAGARAWAHARGGRPGGRGRRDPGRARPGGRDGRAGPGRPCWPRWSRGRGGPPRCRRRCWRSRRNGGWPNRPGGCSTWVRAARRPGRGRCRGWSGWAMAAAGRTRPGSPPPPACSPPVQPVR